MDVLQEEWRQREIKAVVSDSSEDAVSAGETHCEQARRRTDVGNGGA